MKRLFDGDLSTSGEEAVDDQYPPLSSTLPSARAMSCSPHRFHDLQLYNKCLTRSPTTMSSKWRRKRQQERVRLFVE